MLGWAHSFDLMIEASRAFSTNIWLIAFSSASFLWRFAKVDPFQNWVLWPGPVSQNTLLIEHPENWLPSLAIKDEHLSRFSPAGHVCETVRTRCQRVLARHKGQDPAMVRIPSACVYSTWSIVERLRFPNGSNWMLTALIAIKGSRQAQYIDADTHEVSRMAREHVAVLLDCRKSVSSLDRYVSNLTCSARPTIALLVREPYCLLVSSQIHPTRWMQTRRGVGCGNNGHRRFELLSFCPV